MKTRMIAFGTAVLVGLASTAFATEPFDTKSHRPVHRDPGFGAYAQAPSWSARGGAGHVTQPFTAEERALFERVGRPE